MKYQRHLAMFLVIFLSVLGGYFLSYANFSQEASQNSWVSKNEVYAKNGSDLASRNPNFAELQKVFRAVPTRILPSVVQINVSSLEDAPSMQDNPFFRFFGQPPKNAPKREYRRAGLGSGSIIKKQGESYYVLTNNHVIKNADDIEIITYSGEKFPAKIVGNDERVDLAVIQFTPTDKSPDNPIAIAELGNSSDLKIGDIVMAIGSPDGLQSTVTQGIVSYVGRRGGPGGNINDFIQTDASINRGNSGGPLVNMNGQIVGINTWIASESGASAGLGFAIPIDNAKSIIDSFLKDGKVSYGWLGVVVPKFQELVAQLGSQIEQEVFDPMGLSDKKGAFVSDVQSDSPAGKAGILPGDFIIALNGEPIQSTDELMYSVGMLRPGKKVNLRLIRNSREQEFNLTLGKRLSEEALQKGTRNNWPGISVLPLSKKIAEQLEKISNGRIASEENSGLLVVVVRDESATQVVGIQEGDVITEINGKKVSNLAEFYVELNKSDAQNTIFTYKRKGYELETPTIRRK